MPDLSPRECALLAPIAAAVLWMGVYPESFLAPMRGDVQILLDADRPRRAGGRRAADAGQGRVHRRSTAEAQLMDWIASLQATLPELVLSVGAIALMLVAAWGGQRLDARCVSWTAVAVLVGAGIALAGPASYARRRRSTACTAPTRSPPSPRC